MTNIYEELKEEMKTEKEFKKEIDKELKEEMRIDKILEKEMKIREFEEWDKRNDFKDMVSSYLWDDLIANGMDISQINYREIVEIVADYYKNKKDVK